MLINPYSLTPMATLNASRLTKYILIGLVSGALFGLLLNFILNSVPDKTASLILSIGPEGVFHFAGTAFVNLLKVLVVPLVLVSLTCGTAALGDVSRLGRIGARTIGLYLFTTAVAISIAIGFALLFKPGSGLEMEATGSGELREAPPLVDVFTGMIPSNIFDAMASGSMLQVIAFSLLLGIALTLSGKAGERILEIFNQLNTVVLQMVWLIMRLAPYGVFALVANTFATQGFSAILPLSKYFILVILALLLQAVLTYPILLKTLSGLSPLEFVRRMREAQIFAFSTASSNATIPVTLRTVENRLGVPNSIASFTVPLGATINMDGTAIMQGVATVFIAQAYGLNLTPPDLLMVILTATLASIGTAGVPGVGLIMLSMVLTQVNLPVEGIALIIGIDRLLDMLRTAVNITGDAMVTCVIAKWEGSEEFAGFPPETEES